MGLIVTLVILALIVFWAVGMYNNLVNSRNRVRNAFSQIDVQLTRRYDLIPNLVETVKGYMTYEKSTLGSTLGRLFALTAAYPDLKASQNMQQLQEELTSTENKVAFARQAFNDSVLSYNNACQNFPGNLLANNFGFKPAEFLEVEEPAKRETPKVSFN